MVEKFDPFYSAEERLQNRRKYLLDPMTEEDFLLEQKIILLVKEKAADIARELLLCRGCLLLATPDQVVMIDPDQVEAKVLPSPAFRNFDFRTL